MFAYTLFFDTKKSIFFYNAGLINGYGVKGGVNDISFTYDDGLDKTTVTMSLNEFVNTGFTVPASNSIEAMVSISSDTDIIVGSTASDNVYRIDGSLPNLYDDLSSRIYSSRHILDFDRLVRPIFNTKKIVRISPELLANQASEITYIGRLFSSNLVNKPSSLELHDIPKDFLQSMNNLKVINGFFDNCGSVKVLRDGMFNNLNKIEYISGLQYTRGMYGFSGFKINSDNLKFVSVGGGVNDFNLLPVDMLKSLGTGKLTLDVLKYHPGNKELYSQGVVFNTPNKDCRFLTNYVLTGSTVPSVVDCKSSNYANVGVGRVMSIDEVGEKWAANITSNAIPKLRDITSQVPMDVRVVEVI